METPAGTSRGTQQQEGAQRTLLDERWTLPPLQLFPFVAIFTSSLSSQHCPVLLPDCFPSFIPPNVLSLLIFSSSSLLAGKHLCRALSALLWKETPEGAPEARKIPEARQEPRAGQRPSRFP